MRLFPRLALAGSIALVATGILSTGVGVAVSQDLESGSSSDRLVFDQAQTSFVHNSFVAAPISGIVQTVRVTEGQVVDDDALLLDLNRDLAEQELQAAEVELEAAALNRDNDLALRKARRTFELEEHTMRKGLLANDTYAGVVSDMELAEIELRIDRAAVAVEQEKRKLQIAALELQQRKAALSVAKTILDRHSVRAHFSGVVVEVDVEPGSVVAAGKPLIRVVSLDPLRVTCFVSESQAALGLVDRAVQFTTAGEKQTLSGKVTFVAPEIEPVTGKVRLHAEVANPKGLVRAGARGQLVVE